MRLLLSTLTLAAPLAAGALVAAGVQAGGEPVPAPDDTGPPAVSAAPSRPPRAAGPRMLRAPALSSWTADPAAPAKPGPATGDDALVATALHFDAQVYVRPASDPKVAGIVRRGEVLPVARAVTGPGCRRGRWYELEGDGVVCTSKGFNVGDAPYGVDQLAAEPDQPLPYRFAQVETAEAPRFYRLPTEAEDAEARAAIAAGDPTPEVVEQVMKGDYFVALDRLEGAYYRTVRGRYVAAADVEILPTPAMVGERLGPSAASLPLAFVYGADEQPLFRVEGATATRVGVAQKHARFLAAREVSLGGKTLVVGPDGVAVARGHVRVARAIERPSDVPPEVPWIHVDLAEQTLVAYEGDTPVYATLVSSGKEGYDTPRGHFRVRLKYLSTTMSGADPIDGFYEVEEVPWTMYYFEGYALHGAYWHDDFGKVRSHGCTNIAPADARWLYYWSSPEVPAGWHGRRYRKGGSHIWFTR